MNVTWSGVFPAATTAFAGDQSIDLEATVRHYDTLIKAGVHGLIVLGTVGENSSLDGAEKLEVLRAAPGGDVDDTGSLRLLHSVPCHDPMRDSLLRRQFVEGTHVRLTDQIDTTNDVEHLS